MDAKINGTNQVVTGKTLTEIKRNMMGMLKVEGPRGLTATADNGAVIHVELYDGQDYIKTADGRFIK